MRLKVSVEELIDNDCLTKYAENRQTQVTELGLEKEDEVYISEAEAEEWGFMDRSLDLFGGAE